MKTLLTIITVLWISVSLLAQAPEKMSYQAVIRNNNNQLINNQSVGIQISIFHNVPLDGNVPVYVETQTPTTNENGLVSLEIGAGNIVSGIFSTIDWANGPFYIKTAADPSGGTNYSITGTSQLLSVPYALYATRSGDAGNYWKLTGNSGTLDDGNYFIGTTDNTPLNFKVNNKKAGRIDPILYNTFFGLEAGYSNTSGSYNTANGTSALYFNTIGNNNTANGYASLYFNTTGNYNTGMGQQTLYKNTSGTENTAVGQGALYSNTVGANNTAIGTSALINSVGNYNVAVGKNALLTNTVGNNNTAIGYGANVNNNSLSNSTVIGNGATATASNQVRIGNANVNGLYFGTDNNLAVTTDSLPNMYYDYATGQIMRTTVALDNNSVNGNTHAIGDGYGGGIVFYVYDNGQHGLIAAPSDQSTGIQWYNGAYINTNAIRDGINAGMFDTERIIATQGAGSYAAQLCANYQGDNYGDWYLPSKYELNLLYIQQATVGGFSSFTYLSATAYDNVNAWVQDFGNGTQTAGATNALLYARAIRAF